MFWNWGSRAQKFSAEATWLTSSTGGYSGPLCPCSFTKPSKIGMIFILHSRKQRAPAAARTARCQTEIRTKSPDLKIWVLPTTHLLAAWGMVMRKLQSPKRQCAPSAQPSSPAPTTCAVAAPAEAGRAKGLHAHLFTGREARGSHIYSVSPKPKPLRVPAHHHLPAIWFLTSC